MTFTFESVKQWLVSQYYSKREYISVSRGATDKNRPVIVGTDGKLDGSLLDRADIFSDAEGDPANVGTAADGASTYAARRNHVHDIAANYVDNTRLADMAQSTIKGRAAAAGTGDPTDLTAAQLVTILTAADGAASLLDADFLDGLNSTAFAILAGQAGGQTLNGDTAASGNLTLVSTANATKGKVLFGSSAYDEVNNRLGVKTATPSDALHLHGTDSNAAGPHLRATTAADAYPLLYGLFWAHDNVSLAFDAYYEAGWKSSSAGSNALINKAGNHLIVYRNSGTTAGNTITWTAAIDIDLATGMIGIINAPTAYMDTPASTTSRSGVRIRSGTAPSSPNSGDLWYDGTNLKFRDGGTTRTITWV